MLSMDLQFFSWVIDDAREYIHAPYETRTFRDRGGFYDFAAFAQSFISDRTSYIFLAERDWPYLGNMRYLTYPSIPGNAFTKDDLWVIYNRPDIRLNEHNQLISDGVVLSNPGKVLGIFDATSFIFQAPPTK